MWKCVVLCIVLTLCRDVRGDIGDLMSEVIQKCCNDGSGYARKHAGDNCIIYTAPADIPSTFGSLCVMAQAQCCKEYFKKKEDCDGGIEVAMSTGKCDGTKGSTKVCCDECSRGSTAGLAGGEVACTSRAHAGSADELLSEDAYTQCCLKTVKEGPPTLTKPEVTLASLCEDYAPNELCAHHCIPVPGSYKCECNPGFMLMADGRNCREVVKNRCKPKNPCQHKCNDNGVDVLCSCRRGYELMPDGKSCQDINECLLDIRVCLPETQCINLQGSYRCQSLKKPTEVEIQKGQCPPGFARNIRNNVCDDINECKLIRPPCPAYLCMNTVGGYKCGGVLGDPVNLASTPHPDMEDRCPPGFTLGSQGDCEDVDECASLKDDCNRLSQFCVNTHSSFYCQDMASKHCPPGFKVDAMTNRCEDINECDEESEICGPDKVCVNQLGQYDCKQKATEIRPKNGLCPDGTRMNPTARICEDINECAEGTHLCDQHQNCINTMGNFECHCKMGYELDATTGACVDVNECATHQHDCIVNTQRCDNTIGSYLCIRITSCGTGYILQHSTGKCEDVDECALGTHNCAIAGPEYQCLNILGSFRCVRQRTTTTTTTAAPEYEYEYYDSDEEIDANQPTSTNKTEIPVTAIDTPFSSPSPVPSSSPTPEVIPTPEEHKPIENNPVEIRPEERKQDDNNIIGSDPTNDSSKDDAERPKPIPEEPRKPIDHVPEVPRYIAPLYTTAKPLKSTSTSIIKPIEPENRPDIVYEPNSEPPQQKETPDATYYETRPEKPEHTNEIEPPTERVPERPIEEPSRPIDLPSRPIEEPSPKPTYSPYKPKVSTLPPSVNVGEPSIEPPTERVPERPIEVSSRPIDVPSRPIDVPSRPIEEPSPKRVFIPYRPQLRTLRPVVNVGEPSIGKDDNSVVDSRNKWTVTRPVDCPAGYEANDNGGCFDIDECATNRHSCSGFTENCRNTIGGYVCICAPGFRRDQVTGACDLIITTSSTTSTTTPAPTTTPEPALTTTPEPAPTTSSTQRALFFGYPDDRPLTTRPFRPRSSCDAGFHHNAQTGRCEDINECTNGQANCAAVEICVNTRGGYRCECPPNWHLDDIRHRCVPIRNNGVFPPGYGNEPAFPPADPQETFGHGSEGTNSVDPEITQIEDRGTVLKCPWGYRLGDDNSCVDVDECATGEAECGVQQICTNLVGGYTCSCPRGHRLIGDHECRDVDECALAGNMSICSRNADCVNTIGSYQCKCHNGFTTAPVNDKVCVDVDECLDARPGTLCQHRCSNVWGSYRCSCHRGYRLSADNRTCADVNECVQFKSKMPCIGTCLNEPGSYRCACPIGYRLSEDKRSCIDIDECETREASCQTGVVGGTSHVCFNTRGSYHCHRITCPVGYELESKHRCTKTERVCKPGDWDCAHQPTTISYNFITFVSKLYVPDANVKLFTMRGHAWPYTELTFQLRLVNINAPPSVKEKADINAFLLQQAGHESVISLVRPLEGPQSIELELSMELHSREQFGGTAIAKVFIYVSEYEF